MTAQQRGIDEVAEEIRHHCNCSKLAAYRMAHGWSQPQAAERCQRATGAFMDQPLLSKLEQFPAPGARAPTAAQLIGLAAVYATTPLRLVAPATLDRLDPHERAVLVRCNTAFTPTPPATGHLDSLDGARRVRLADDGLEAEREMAMAARRALRFCAAVEGSNVGPETLEQLRDEVARLALAYKTKPVATLLGDLTSVQDVAFRLLEGRQRPAQTRQLYFLAGVTCGLLANACHDLADPHAAMTQARTAYVCADNAGHDGLRAWVRGQQSVIAYWAGWPHEALRYAQLGSGTAQRVTGTVAVLLPALEARARAALGDENGSQAAIEHAHAARERTVPDELDEFGGLLTFDRPKQLYYAADATVWVPDEEERAEREASQAVDAYEHAEETERSIVCEAGSRADLALARAHRGELDGAREALRPVLELPSAQRARTSIVALTLRVHAALSDPRYRGSPAAAETQQQIEAFCRASSRRLPP
ncbi:MAG: helix-turn-helix domain-containing protein [Egibacteraceae bacterium]